MALSTYTELIASVANWAHRSDLTALMLDFVTMAEARISRDLRLRKQITSTTLTTTGGVRSVALPADWLEFENLSLSAGGTSRALVYVPVEHIDVKYDSAFTGMPAVYTIEGENILLAPTPDAAYNIGCMYFARFPSVITADSNWLLTNHPNIYLFSTLAEVFHYIQNPDQIQIFTARYNEGLQQLQDQDDRATHSGSSLRVKVI
jgi:hypothetical protein